MPVDAPLRAAKAALLPLASHTTARDPQVGQDFLMAPTRESYSPPKREPAVNTRVINAVPDRAMELLQRVLIGRWPTNLK
jgi:hypothetical protein